MDYLADTNIILRFVRAEDARHTLVFDAVRKLFARGDRVVVAAQTVYEFWSVATRPVNVNGLGWSTEHTRAEVDVLLEQFHLLNEKETLFPAWLALVTLHEVSGKPAHDARLVAAMKTHEIQMLLTLNTDDFKRYSEINAVHPSEVSA